MSGATWKLIEKHRHLRHRTLEQRALRTCSRLWRVTEPMPIFTSACLFLIAMSGVSDDRVKMVLSEWEATDHWRKKIVFIPSTPPPTRSVIFRRESCFAEFHTCELHECAHDESLLGDDKWLMMIDGEKSALDTRVPIDNARPTFSRWPKSA